MAKFELDEILERRKKELREENPIVSTEPLYTIPMTADQRIRAKAIQAAAIFYGPDLQTVMGTFWDGVYEFERYIRGK